MLPPRDSLRARILAVLFQTKRAEVPWRVLLRNTAAVILPLAAGIATGRVGVGLWISVGAIVTMYSDQPGPYRQRLARLLAVSVAGGLAAFVGMVLGGNLPAVLAAMAVIGFVGALLVVFGDAAGRVGMAAMILLAITSADPANSAWAALESAALIASGGVLLTLLSVAAWPLQRYGPEREALAAVYRGLAALARQHDVESGSAPALSESMTALQHTLLGPHRARGQLMDSFGVLLELAERMRLELTALTSSEPDQIVTQLVRTEAAILLESIGNVIVEGADAGPAMTRLLQSLRAAEAGLPESEATVDRTSARHFHALAGQLAAAVRNAGRATAVGALRAAEEDLQLPSAVRPQSPAALVLASLTPRSAAFRHAVRTALCFAAAACVGRVLDLSHGYWIPMTVAIVLRSDYGSTFSYGLLRVAGTLAGLLLTTGLLHVLPPHSWQRLAMMAVLCAAFRYFGAVNYGVAVTALTGMVVLLLALAGEPAEPTMISRLIATVIGSAMALTAYGLWPTRERGQIRTSLARLLDAYALYLASLGSDEAHERRDARNSARVARANAEAALARLLAEPQTSSLHAELARSLLTNSNRLARTTMTLEAALGASSASPPGTGSANVRSPGEPVTALIDQGAASLRKISEAVANETGAECILPRLRATQRDLVRKIGASGDGGVGGELAMLTDRLVDNINTLAHVVARVDAARPR